MAQKAMEELREIATLHYETASSEVQNRAVEFFNSMDTDGDGHVNVQELWSFMTEQGHPAHLCNQRFFDFLDTDGSGGLSFDEVKTLFYIINSGRPCCAWCTQFIAGTFFSCPICSFQLCPNCFKDAQPRNHVHDGCRIHFLDTFAFLQTLRSRNQLVPKAPQEPTLYSPPVESIQQIASSSSRAIVVRQRTSKREVTYKAMMLALAAAGVECSIL